MPDTVFRAKAPGVMRLLIADFGLTVEDAAAIMGNLGHESGGLTLFQEIAPTVAGSRGGWGWAQWTGPRRVQFEAYCRRNNLDPKSDKANYGWLFVELRGTEKRAIDAVKGAKGLRNKVIAFEGAFERAGVKHYDSRVAWAEKALAAYEEDQPAPAPADIPTDKELEAMIQVLLPMLMPIIQKAITDAISRPDVPLESPAPRQAAAEVVEVVKQTIARSPEIQHVTNTETHWYQQRSKWAMIFAAVTPLVAGVTGYSISPEMQEMAVSAVIVVGNAVAAYLAYRAGTASKPLGT